MPTRYTLHLTGEAARKAHLRTILKTMGFTDIIITEKEAEASKPKPMSNNCPSSPESLMVATLFSRKPETEWSEPEITAFKATVKLGLMTIENMTIVTDHYRRERKRPDNYCRTSLLTFCKWFSSEVDKARSAKPQDRKHEWPQNVVKLPVVDEAEADRIRELAKQQAQAYRNEARP